MVRPSPITLLAVLAVAMLGAFAVALSQRGKQGTADRPAAQPAARGPRPAAAVAPPTQKLQPLPAVQRQAQPKPKGYGVLRVRAGQNVAIRSKPGGRVLTSVGATTQFGSPSTLAVAAQHGGWLGVTSTNLPNGQVGWVKARPGAFERHRTRLAIKVDLSRKRLQLVKGDHVLRTATVGIGRPGSPTPRGRFAITDKLSGSSYGPYYGCCILALSGHQTNTPAGWRGGDRLAIHGTNDPSSIGVPSSAGCLHADAEDLHALMRRVPLGTPVFIRA